MAIIHVHEVLYIAQISRISIHSAETDKLLNQLQSVLGYAQRVSDNVVDVQDYFHKNKNIVRIDEAVRANAEKSFMLAPQQEEHFYVVPAVL